MKLVQRVVMSVAILAAAVSAWVPLAPAHQDGCLVSLHQGEVQTHQLCTTNPETCFSNIQRSSSETNVVCFDPEPNPCVLKVQVLGHQTQVCP